MCHSDCIKPYNTDMTWISRALKKSSSAERPGPGAQRAPGGYSMVRVNHYQQLPSKNLAEIWWFLKMEDPKQIVCLLSNNDLSSSLHLRTHNTQTHTDYLTVGCSCLANTQRSAHITQVDLSMSSSSCGPEGDLLPLASPPGYSGFVVTRPRNGQLRGGSS